MRTIRAVAATVATLAAATGCAAADGEHPLAGRSATTRQQLDHLTVAPAADAGRYQRTTQFGSAWTLDSDRNGCRQRDDVLRRDLTAVRTSGRCTVVAGTLQDPYTGKTVQFSKAHAAAVQVDHVYPLGLAWRHGAAGWPQQRRVQFANDLDLNLIAVDGPTNESKGDKGPGQWLPPRRDEWCDYAERYVRVAAAYDLSITAADRKALITAFITCPGGAS